MSAYLMDQYDTTKLAVFARAYGLVPCAINAAKSLRKANNFALMKRYGDKPIYLRNVPLSLNENAESFVKIDPEYHHKDILALAHRFLYQCDTGRECENQKGYKLLNQIINTLE